MKPVESRVITREQCLEIIRELEEKLALVRSLPLEEDLEDEIRSYKWLAGIEEEEEL